MDPTTCCRFAPRHSRPSSGACAFIICSENVYRPLATSGQPLHAPDWLLLAPPVCNDQLGLYFKFNTRTIGSHPDNPTLEAMLETCTPGNAENVTFYDSHPDADADPVAFDDYARRLSRLTGPALMNEVIDARLPWLRQLRELRVLLVSPVTDAHQIINLRWFSRMLDTHLPLDRMTQVGSGRTTR
ncbi:hypothetical protein ACLUUI_14015 [Enterobacterales bacterium AW_CKDN230030176-1A_HGKHYDSX7]